MKQILIFILFLITIDCYGQKRPFEENIETDSSKIRIIRNSVYKTWNETYKYKDSVRYIAWFIDDTTKVNYEQWSRKNNERFGISREYKKDGTLMYEWNHETEVCEINKSQYPYHDILEKMKSIADSLIISAYSKEFFDRHVRFDYNCYVYDKDGYVGTWTEPIQRKPTEFLFRYSVKLSTSDWYPEMIGINLDSLGNYIPSIDDNSNRYGFENIKEDKKTFNIDIHKATEIAKLYGLVVSDTSEISEFLTWENFRKQTFLNGQFRYYITELTGKTEYTEGKDRKGIIFRFNVYSFNPWTGEFIEKKKMKSRKEWGPVSGHTTGLIPDKE